MLLDSSQAHGGTQAVRPVVGQRGVQMPPNTMHAAPGPHSASQSVSVLQSRQVSSNWLKSVKSAQKPALPVVFTQRQLGLLGLQGTPPPEQLSESAKQMPLLWATQTLVSGWPGVGALPSQMPEQQRVLSPWHGCPTS